MLDDPRSGLIGEERRLAANELAAQLLCTSDEWTSDARAIGLLEEVRQTSQSHDAVWVIATGNLAAALGRRTAGDVVNNWARGISLLRELIATDGIPETDLAVYETNLGLALTNRPGGPTAVDLDEALEWIQRGLNRRSPEKSVEDWAYSAVNLGHAYQQRGRADDLGRAVDLYRSVTSRLRKSDLTRMRIFAQVNLAIALRRSGVRPAQEAVAVARAAVRRAQALGDSASALVGWALGVLGDSHAAAEGSASAAAMDAWQRSVDAFADTAHAPRMLPGAAQLAEEYFNARAWEPLAKLYERMLDAFDALYMAQDTSESRRRVLAEHPRLARWAAVTFARTGRVQAAVQVLERARTRVLDAVSRLDTADLVALEQARPDLAAHYRGALAAYRATMYQPPSMSAAEDAPAVRAAARLNRIIAEIRDTGGFQTFLHPPTASEALAAAGVRQAIYVVSAPMGTYVLSLEADPLNGDPSYHSAEVDITSRDIAHLLTVDTDTGEPGLLPAQLAGNREVFDQTLTRIGRFLAPLVRTIGNRVTRDPANPSVLILTGITPLLPILALPATDEPATLDDLGELHLAPSLSTYAASRRRAARPIRPVFVGVADPTNDLDGARGEAATVASRPGWHSTRLESGDNATLNWLIENAPAASHLHLACHGSNELTDPDGSYLVLAQGVRLTVPTLVDQISLQARVATASACQSGHYDAIASPDEHVGLATGLLEAGAACAVVSLWPVDDESTALLMARFYELLNQDGGTRPQDQRPQAALRRARQWLRGLTDSDRNTYLNGHPELAATLRSRGLPRATALTDERGPYAAVQDWGAFVAYGY